MLLIASEADSVDTFLRMEDEVMTDEDAQQAMAGYHDLIVSGRRDVFRKVP